MVYSTAGQDLDRGLVDLGNRDPSNSSKHEPVLVAERDKAMWIKTIHDYHHGSADSRRDVHGAGVVGD